MWQVPILPPYLLLSFCRPRPLLEDQPPRLANNVRNSKHVLNAQVSIRSPCCRKWFDCAECHHENESHDLKPTLEMIFACKKCRKCFRKDVEAFEEADEYCPHCDNHFVIEALTPKPALRVEGEDARVDNRMLKDDRLKEEELRTIFDVDKEADRLG